MPKFVFHTIFSFLSSLYYKGPYSTAEKVDTGKPITQATLQILATSILLSLRHSILITCYFSSDKYTIMSLKLILLPKKQYPVSELAQIYFIDE